MNKQACTFFQKTFSLGIAVVITSFFASSAMAAELLLTTTATTVRVGETFTMNVSLAGDDQTMGTDLVLTYDPTVFQVVEVKDSGLYPVYNPPKAQRVDATQRVIRVSGSADIGKTIPARGQFAEVTFQALQEGTGEVSVLYDEDDTTLTGVLNIDGGNVLTSVGQPVSVEVSGSVGMIQASANGGGSFWDSIVNFFKNMFSFLN